MSLKQIGECLTLHDPSQPLGKGKGFALHLGLTKDHHRTSIIQAMCHDVCKINQSLWTRLPALAPHLTSSTGDPSEPTSPKPKDPWQNPKDPASIAEEWGTSCENAAP